MAPTRDCGAWVTEYLGRKPSRAARSFLSKIAARTVTQNYCHAAVSTLGHCYVLHVLLHRGGCSIGSRALDAGVALGGHACAATGVAYLVVDAPEFEAKGLAASSRKCGRGLAVDHGT